jgi:uncharacterized MAPEG superfamily protein
MSHLLSLVVCMASMTWLLLVVAALIRTRAWTRNGLLVAFGNRDNLTAPSPLAGRADGVARNTLENLVLFVALALVAHAAGATNPRVTLGADVFFWARLVYVPVYLAGIPFLRTAVWAVSIAGLGLMIAGMF